MKDNRTSQPAAEYDGNIEKTMPYYAAFHERTLDLIEVIKPAPAAWLDTGAGTGTFVKKALARFPEASFVAADPSSAMLKIAKVKLAGADCAFVQQPTEELALPDDSFDVVTAILSHHYYSAAAGKKKAVANCLHVEAARRLCQLRVFSSRHTGRQGHRPRLLAQGPACCRQGRKERG